MIMKKNKLKQKQEKKRLKNLKVDFVFRFKNLFIFSL